MSRPAIPGTIATAIFVCAMFVAASSVPLGAATTGTVTESIATEQAALDTSNFVQRNNTTVPHENPKKVDGEGNLASVQKWLAGRMSGVLIDCTEGLLAERGRACKNLDERYPEWLGDYVDVTREIESQNEGQKNNSQDNETNTSATFEQTKENQQQYVSIVEKFNRTLANYHEARENGNTRQARKSGRKLLRLARRANSTGANLTENYRAIGNISDANVTIAITNVNNTTTHLTTIADTISAEQFIDTTLTVTVSRERISFRRPLRVRGQLTDESGTPLSGQTIVLHAGNYSRTTTTDESGEFSITYRPTLVSLDTQNLTVRYVPGQLSPYLSNETTIPVSIEQVEPTITLAVRPNTTRFGKLVTISGRVTADGIGVPSLPVVVTIDGQRIGMVNDLRTTSKGRYRLTVRLPANVSAGTQTVRLSIPLEGRAIAGVTATEPITVNPTPTRLSIDAPAKYSLNRSNTTGHTLPVSGRLTTKNAIPITNRVIEFRVQGMTIGETRTDSTGRYATNVSVPATLFEGQEGTVPLTVVAVYNGEATSFESSRAEAQIRVFLPEDGIIERLLLFLNSLSILSQFLLGIGVLFVGILVVYAFGRRRGSADSSDPSNGIDPSGSVTETTERPSLIDIARRHLAAGDAEQAIVTGYLAVRERLGETFGLASTQTHWEFLQACRARVSDGTQLGSLRRLTEAYERAAFAPQTPSEETATEAVENANQLEENTGNTDDSTDER